MGYHYHQSLMPELYFTLSTLRGVFVHTNVFDISISVGCVMPAENALGVHAPHDMSCIQKIKKSNHCPALTHLTYL